MSEQLFRVDRIAKILEENRNATGAAAYAPYAVAKILTRELDEYAHEHQMPYAIEKVGQLDWHIGAMFGLDVDNGHDSNQHYVWALSAMDNLRSEACFGNDE